MISNQRESLLSGRRASRKTKSLGGWLKMVENSVLELLNKKGENYIFPFFWQHGETEERLRHYMDVIHKSNIAAVCVEARPHPDFGGEQWWHDMDVIMDEARKRNMRVWVLDDAHFPTGYANGWIKEKHRDKSKWYLNQNSVDVLGENPSVEIDIDRLAKPSGAPVMTHGFRNTPETSFTDDKIIAIMAGKVDKDNRIGEVIDLTDKVSDWKLFFQVPEGVWRVTAIYKTRNYGGRPNYINLIDMESCRVQIDAVYEPHYSRYKDDFGKTFAGFFSDEPSLGNTLGYDFDGIVGRKKMPLPWSDELEGLLKESFGDGFKSSLLALWYAFQEDERNAKIRYEYMDKVSALVSKNFSQQIGEWCKEHGVEYVGHIIEDNNAHARLCCSIAHYFRGLWGQHMSGIDIVGDQVTPEAPYGSLGESGEFFYFMLAKMASSLGHIDPKKRGRTMCEIFGAAGWKLGVKGMKWLLDHAIIRGVNHFVPHAFSPKDYPDPDCPPHFYAGGHNPQYPHFGQLMAYANRLCHLFNNGIHAAPAAILYHGDQEWAGEAMLSQKPAVQLTENQIDFDIIPADVFAFPEKFNADLSEGLSINGETYKILIIPFAEYITKEVALFAANASEKGFPVVFVDGLPVGISNTSEAESKAVLGKIIMLKPIPLLQLAQHIKSMELNDIELDKPFDRLTYYWYQKNEDLFMFFNEDMNNTYEGWIKLPVSKGLLRYDAFKNELYSIRQRKSGDRTEVFLKLEPYQSVIVVTGEASRIDVKDERNLPQNNCNDISDNWTISYATAKEYPNFHDQTEMTALENIARIRPDFSGTVRYERDFVVDRTKSVFLDIQYAYEAVVVYVNKEKAATILCPPYRLDISDYIKEGKNSLTIEVTNTLERSYKHNFLDERGQRYVTPVTQAAGMFEKVLLWYS